MQAFKNSSQIKSECILQLEKHYKMDEITKGTYWENGKGCAVGCTIHSSNHIDYEKKLGIPEWLAHLEDFLFENLPNDKEKKLPIKFIKSIPVGFENWSKIYHKLCIYLLTDIVQTGNDKKVIKAVENIVTLHNKVLRGEIESNLFADSVVWFAAESAAESASWSARSVGSARSAAESAKQSAAESAAESAAWSAESAAESAKQSVGSAWSAAWSAVASTANSAELAKQSAESAAESAAKSVGSAGLAIWSAAIVNISDKLLELLNNEKLTK